MVSTFYLLTTLYLYLQHVQFTQFYLSLLNRNLFFTAKTNGSDVANRITELLTKYMYSVFNILWAENIFN